MKVISILNEGDYEKALESMCPWDAEGMVSVWSSFEDKDMDQNYEDYYTGEPWNLNITRWLSGYPAKQAEDVIFFAYRRGSASANTTDRIEMGEHQKWTNRKQIYCVGDSPEKKTLWVKIRGLCEKTYFETSYYLAPFGSGYNTLDLKYLGLKGETIAWNSPSWVLTSKGGHEAKLGTTALYLGLGQHNVWSETDSCTAGKEDKYVYFVLAVFLTLN